MKKITKAKVFGLTLAFIMMASLLLAGNICEVQAEEGYYFSEDVDFR